MNEEILEKFDTIQRLNTFREERPMSTVELM